MSVPTLPPLTAVRAALVSRALAWTTALLLFGHGALGALDAKEVLVTHFRTIGLSAVRVVAAGWLEIGLAVLVLVRPRPALLVGVALWKMATELLYPMAGASVWEFIERGGSYGAPLALAMLLASRSAAAAGWRDIPVSRPAAALLAVFLATAQSAHAQEVMPGDSLVGALRGGGYVLAFRHTATDHSATDRGPDRASQRNLTDEGGRQAKAIGEAVRALGIPIGEVRANPMYRNRETAEHAFGRATVDSTLGAEGPRTGTEAIAALRALLGTPVPPGTNRVVVTRIGILTGAFEGHGVAQMDEGDGIVVRPLGEGAFRVLRHLKAEDWPRLQAVR